MRSNKFLLHILICLMIFSTILLVFVGCSNEYIDVNKISDYLSKIEESNNYTIIIEYSNNIVEIRIDGDKYYFSETPSGENIDELYYSIENGTNYSYTKDESTKVWRIEEVPHAVTGDLDIIQYAKTNSVNNIISVLDSNNFVYVDSVKAFCLNGKNTFENEPYKNCSKFRMVLTKDDICVITFNNTEENIETNYKITIKDISQTEIALPSIN